MSITKFLNEALESNKQHYSTLIIKGNLDIPLAEVDTTGLWEDETIEVLHLDLTDYPSNQQINLSKMTNLKEVAFFNGKMKMLPECRGLKKLKHMSLEVEYLGELKTITPLVGTPLEFLAIDAENNRITSLPDDFAKLINLEIMMLYMPSITSIGDGIPRMSKLRRLGLTYSEKLKELPNISKMKSLEYLSVAYTGLSELPEGIQELKKLKEVYTVGSKIDVDAAKGVLPRVSFNKGSTFDER